MYSGCLVVQFFVKLAVRGACAAPPLFLCLRVNAKLCRSTSGAFAVQQWNQFLPRDISRLRGLQVALLVGLGL